MSDNNVFNENLIDKARQGDQQAWHEIDKICRPKLTSFCRKWFPNTADAEEAAHEVLVQCYRKINLFDDNKKFESWLYTVARNKCNDLMDKQNRMPAEMRNTEDNEIIPASLVNQKDEDINSNLELNFEMNEEYKILLSLLDKIPEEQIFCFVQRVLYDKPFKEIALMAGVTESTVKSRYKYAKKAMHNAVLDYENKNNLRLHRGVFVFSVMLFRKSAGQKGAAALFAGGYAQIKLAATIAGIAVGLVSATAGAAVLLNALSNPQNSVESGYSVDNISNDNTNDIQAVTIPDKSSTDDEAVNPTELSLQATSVQPEATVQTNTASQNITSVKPTVTVNTTADTQPTTIDEDVKNYTYNVLSDGTAEITGYNGSRTALNIPSNIDGYKVTSIGDSTFYEHGELKSIIIPHGIVSIGKYAFFFCENITDVYLPEGLEKIDNFAFFHCFSLENVQIPKSVTTIGADAFSVCKSIKSITIPEGVTSLDMFTFDGCISLTSVTLPSTLTDIGIRNFESCKNLESINIPMGVTAIGEGIFFKSGLVSISIPSSVTSLGEDAFFNCENLTKVTLPSSLNTIDNGAFYGCDSLVDVYYNGTINNWNNIAIADENSSLQNATMHYASKN